MNTRLTRLAVAGVLAVGFGYAIWPQFVRPAIDASSQVYSIDKGDMVLLYEYGEQLNWSGPHRVAESKDGMVTLEVGGELVTVSEAEVEPVSR
jgi:hypothetical protein